MCKYIFTIADMSILHTPTLSTPYTLLEFPALKPQPGNNNTEFTFNIRSFEYLDPASSNKLHTVTVYLCNGQGNRTKMVENTDYTVNPTGEQTQIKFLGSPIPPGSYVLLVPSLPFTRTSDFTVNGPISAATLNTQLDYLTMLSTYLGYLLSYCVSQPIPDCYDPDNRAQYHIVIKDYVDGELLKIQNDLALNSTFKITSAGFSAQDFLTKYQEIVDKLTEVQGLYQQMVAQISTLNQTISNLNGQAAQINTQYGEILTIKSQIEDIQRTIDAQLAGYTQFLNNYLNDINIKIAEILQLKTDIEQIKTDVIDILNQVGALKGQIEQIIAKIPDPVGAGKDLTIVTTGPVGPNNNSYELKPYIDLKTPLDAALPDKYLVTTGIGGVKFEDKYWFINGGSGIQNIPDGTVLAIGRDINNNKQIVATTTALANTAQVASVDPFTEGGTDQAIINENTYTLLDSLTPNASKNPFGDTDLMAEFLVDQNGNLRRSKTAIFLTPQGTPAVLKEKLGALNYYTSNADYIIPHIIGGQNILDIPFSIIFCLKITSNATDSTPVLANSSFGVLIKKLALDYFLQTGTLLEIPVKVGEYAFYVFTYNPKNPADTYNKVEGQQGIYNSSAVTVTVTPIAAQDMINPPAAGDMALTLSDDVRLARIAFIKGTVSTQEVEQYMKHVLGIVEASTGGGGGGGTIVQYVPDPATGQNGQAPVISNSAYILKNVVTLDNPMNGYTVDGSLNLTTALPNDGRYNLVIDRTNNQITIKAEQMYTKLRTEYRKFTQPISHTTPVQIGTASDLIESRFIQNVTDGSIVVGNLTDLSTDPTKGILIEAGKCVTTRDNRDMYMIALVADITFGYVTAADQIYIP